MSALAVAGLSKAFGALRVADGIDLAVPEGERRGIIGPNGAGKTTFFNIISGWLRPDSGRVEVFGRDVTGLAPDRIAHSGVRRSFQKSALFDGLTVAENLRLAVQATDGSRFDPWRGTARHRRVVAAAQALAERVSLADELGRRAGELSYGRKRQLEIALALAEKPRILLLDEPAAGASPYERRLLADLLQALPRDITIVLVEHDLDFVFNLCDRITVLVRGRVLMTGTPGEVAASSEVQTAYLGTAHA
ncbi:ABC transporter ATP-binding protein [Faunimonas sp. B44]|uniref:ABC transporter ATP-binding protein n=1 Tax=Faunimonas sp. B44 TaxID=3461493 RepID=UPI00404423F6